MSARMLLAMLAGIVVIVALLTPEGPAREQGGRSSYSAAPGGARMAFDLAAKMGWRVSRRIAPLDSAADSTTVHVVLAPNDELGAREVHRLLTDVRRGGGLIFTLDGADEISDSIGVVSGPPGRFLSSYSDPSCPPQTFGDRALLSLPPEVRQIVWRKTPPADAEVTPLVTTNAQLDEKFPAAIGFSMGKGRVAVVSNSAVFSNEAVRVCTWGADVAVARILEFLRPRTRGGSPDLIFDEFHHGFGMHGGSVRAITEYLGDTASGHVLVQALVAGLVLVLALAPRAIVPRDAERVARRSPLEHAEALGHALADVGATRTAAGLLVSGLRRRVGRTGTVTGARGLDDAAFLDSVRQRYPTLAEPVGVLQRAMRAAVTPQELGAVGGAVRTIEGHLTQSSRS